MIVIEGSHGEGGGQVLRTALALSLVTGKPFRIRNVRAKRKKPGLLNQHLTALNAAAQIGGAEVEGAALGSLHVLFAPQKVAAGDYSFAIGTAGSTMLVLQTILLPLALTGGASTLRIEGGTHNPAAPPFDFIAEAFLPLLRRMGTDVQMELVRPGFYPAGGGEIRVSIAPGARLGPLDLETRGELVTRRIRAVVANLPLSIAERQVHTAAEHLEWGEESLEARELTGAIGPGNAISVIVGAENVTEVFTAFGERGLHSERMAHEVAEEAKLYLYGKAAVASHLADQLLLPLALGDGGSFTTSPLSSHATTNIEVIRRFVDREIRVEEVSPARVRVTV